jgi:hypothetical protein
MVMNPKAQHGAMNQKCQRKLTNSSSDNLADHKSWKIQGILQGCIFEEFNFGPSAELIFPVRLVNKLVGGKKFSGAGELKYTIYFWCDAEEFDFCCKGSKPLELK